MTRSGDLLGLVRTFVGAMPGPESGGYQQPSAAQEAELASAERLILEGRLEDAAAAAEPFAYSVVRFTDVATGHHLVLLTQDDHTRTHGWGMFVFAPSSTSRLIVEVAHPLDDIDTWTLGTEAFRSVDARALLIAGASRFAVPEDIADVAHDRFTVFEAIHEALLRPDSIVLEPHGFEVDNHGDYGDVVLSTGAASSDPLLSHLGSDLEGVGLSVCIYDGSNCSALGGTTNVQGASTRAAGATFVHMELAPRLRSDERWRRVICDAVAAAIG